MASPPTHVRISDQDGVLIITVLARQLSREAEVHQWRDEMAAAIRAASPAGVVIDMRNVEYLTSIAIFPLVATRSVAEEVDAKLVLCNLSDVVLKVLTIAQLIVESRDHAKRLRLAESLEDAIAIVK